MDLLIFGEKVLFEVKLKNFQNLFFKLQISYFNFEVAIRGQWGVFAFVIANSYDNLRLEIHLLS